MSDIPTLIAVGGYDPSTPLSWREAAAVGLRNHRLYEFPTMGHGSVRSVWYDACPASIARQLLTDPVAEPDASCIADTPPTDFITTADIHPTSAIYRLDSDVIQDRDLLQIAVAGVSLLVLVATLVYGLGYALARLARRRGTALGEGSRRHRIALSASAAASVVFGLWLLGRGLLFL